MPLHVYGVVRSARPDPSSVDGVGTPPGHIGLVRSGELAAAVSTIEADFEPRDADAVRHLEVLIALLRDGPVLPMRFGTVADDEAAVQAEILDPVTEPLCDSLDRLDGLVELRLTVVADEDVELRRLAAESRDVRQMLGSASEARDGLMAHRIAVGERLSHELEARRSVRSELISGRLGPRCVDQQLLPNVSPTTSSHAFLVRADDMTGFDRAVELLFSDLGPGYEVEYVGPLPAVDFINVESHKEPDRWSGTGHWGW